MTVKILIVDDEIDYLESIRRGLITAGYRNVRTESDPVKAASAFERGEVHDIALVDITMPGMSGVELLEVMKKCSPDTECIMVTAVDEARVAVECLKKGAYDYLVKPITRDDLVLRIKHAQERKRLMELVHLKTTETPPRLIHTEAFKNIVTRSPKVLKVLKEAELHAASDVPVLITGESGTGKELLARAVHLASPRARSPFTPVNIAFLAGNLFDAEFFGHTRGAFTGAERDRVGYLESTRHGTMFLDEIGTMPLDLQGKLLRVLQEGEFSRLGTSKTQKTDVRYIAATNEDLERLMIKGMFRKDLYYRLKGAWLHLPPLRERREDVPLLIQGILQDLGLTAGGAVIDPEAVSMLTEYDYPGNIRELKSILQAAVNLAQGAPISPRWLPDGIRARRFSSGHKALGGARRSLSRHQTGDQAEPVLSLAQVEKAHILDVYGQTGGNKSETARLLGIGLNTLRRKLEEYGTQ
jgi:two-component system response regulator AtoC